MPLSKSEVVIRFSVPTSYDHNPNVAAEDRLDSSSMRSKEFKPSTIPISTGASAFLKSALPNPLVDLVTANSKWAGYVRSEITVEEIEALGIKVELTPDECQFPTVAHAHLSLIGIDGDKRDKLVNQLSKKIVYVPPALSS